MHNLFFNDLFFIAEVGQAHEGSLGIAHSYIDALATTKVNAVKFQTHIADAESSVFEPFRVPFSYEDSTRLDYWRRIQFTPEQWKGLKDHCDSVNLKFISSPFSLAAVSMLNELEIFAFKIASGEVRNHLLLKKISESNKPVILSSGMSTFDDLEEAINILKKSTGQLAVLQCTTAYPSFPTEWGLNVIKELKSRFNLPIGFSDHSGNIYACLAATTLGAKIFEFHVTFDKKIFGPDSTSSLTIPEIKVLTDGIQQISESISNSVNKNDVRRFTDMKNIFEKSLSVNRDVKAGEILHEDMLETKKPSGLGIPASDYKSVLGKTFKRNLVMWDFIKKSDLND